MFELLSFFKDFLGALDHGGIPIWQVAGDLLKQYKRKFEGGALSVTWTYLRDSMGTYLSQTNPVSTHREGSNHLRDPRFQLDAFQVPFDFWTSRWFTYLHVASCFV